MINYQFFPRSQNITPQLRSVIECFKRVDDKRNEDCQPKSNEMLALVQPYFEELDYKVESGKADQIFVPVLFGENDSVDKYFAADALSADGKIVIEVEAGRAVMNNQFLKDIFQACMMLEVEYLVIAVLNKYSHKCGGKTIDSPDFQKVKTFLETLYVSNRLRLPLKGILLIGY